MTNPIVTVSVSQRVAPTPSLLQKKGALISQGATTTANGVATLLTQLSDLTAILKAAAAITTMTWLANVVTVTTAAPHGIAVGATFMVTIAGATPSGYNGTYLATRTGASTFTYPLVGDPGANTVPGTYVNADVAELLSMGTTFFAQGTQQAVYVLELGPGVATAGVAALAVYITANPNAFYGYLVPRLWASSGDFTTFLAGFEANTSKTYFWVTATGSNYTNFTTAMKCAFVLIEAPTAPATEFSLAAAFWVALNYSPSSTNKVTPFAFSFLVGVTPYASAGNSALFATFKAASINIVGDGAEGGISNAALFWGTTKDGRDFTYWYSVDWVQITGQQALANAVINGSNDPTNPLYFNQDGINRLQQALAQTMASGVSFGLVLGPPVQTAYDGTQLGPAIALGVYNGLTGVNAVPFAPYNVDNPSDYAIGRYTGLSVIYTPARGFIAIVFNLVVVDFVAQ